MYKSFKIGDENLYHTALKELEDGKQSQPLWIKALTLAGGDEEKAKHRYISLRVEQIKIYVQRTNC